MLRAQRYPPLQASAGGLEPSPHREVGTTALTSLSPLRAPPNTLSSYLTTHPWQRIILDHPTPSPATDCLQPRHSVTLLAHPVFPRPSWAATSDSAVFPSSRPITGQAPPFTPRRTLPASASTLLQPPLPSPGTSSTATRGCPVVPPP